MPIDTVFSADPGHTANTVLSNGNHTAAVAGLNFASVDQSLGGHSSGKWFTEVLVVAAVPPAVGVIGVCNSSAVPANILGGDGNGWGYYGGSGTIIHSNAETPYGGTYGVGDVIGIGVDSDLGNLEFFVNGVSQGIYHDAALIGALVSLAVSDGSSNSSNRITYTLAAGDPSTPFYIAIPPGYQPANGPTGPGAATFFSGS